MFEFLSKYIPLFYLDGEVEGLPLGLLRVEGWDNFGEVLLKKDNVLVGLLLVRLQGN